MTPVFFIKGKVCPYLERSVFFRSRYDEAEVLHNGFLVPMQYASALSLVVAPSGKKSGGNMVVRIACHFAYEG